MSLAPTTPHFYDQVHYPGGPNPDTHPDRLAVMALLHGLHPAPVAHARVLEIGCNEGRNLIPMAYAIPGARFVGFDIAATPIARGRERIQRLGLTNITLLQDDILTAAPTLGTFDYIIAHGIYAWVPAPVRDALLALIRTLLAPNGVAFVSYNALPGGHLRTLVRDILLEPKSRPDTPVDIPQSLALLSFVADSRPENDPYRLLLERESRQLQRKAPNVLFHDELAPTYQPVSFTTFVAHAATHSLQFLAESVLPPPKDPVYHPPTVARIRTFTHGDPIAEEQILDHLRLRMFRETLLCHADQPIDPDLTLEFLHELRLATAAESIPQPDPATRAYRLPGGISMESQDPLTILLMDQLIAASPESIPIPHIEHLLAAHNISFDATAITLIMRLVVARMVDLHAWAAPVSRHLPTHPHASRITREELVEKVRAATLLHTAVSLPDPLVQDLVLLMDGTRDHTALLESLQSRHPEVPPATIAEGFPRSLHLLHTAGILHA